MPAGLAPLIYLVSAALFIMGIKRLQSPDTARNGNMMSALGMLIAIVVTLLDQQIVSFPVIIAGMVVGGGLGFWMARSVKMTSMPQMVALLNGFGGGASLLVAGAEFLKVGMPNVVPLAAETNVTIQLGTFIGSITLTGSFIAFLKLQELMTGKPVTFPLQKTFNALVFLAIVTLGVYQVLVPGNQVEIYYAMVGLSLLLGVLLVIPIGGADMPVVIALLNSYSGLAAAMTGFVIDNQVLIVAGSLVGSSGLILTNIMCKAMNRSLANVLFAAFGADTPGGSGKSAEGLTVNEVSVEDAALRLAYARLVIVVPGYGLAVAQAQHVVRELADLIQKNGGEVKYAIHPVAGRMPGHMNVLLAESNVPYDQLVEMDDINPQFPRADVALVIGANDVVNPAAHNDPSSPIYGMPILDVENAQSTIVMKRSMNPGFAGIQNELFYHQKTSMLFGDAKASLSALVGEIKSL